MEKETMIQLKVGIAGFGVVGKRRNECLDLHSEIKVVGVCTSCKNHCKTTDICHLKKLFNYR